jgi:hypothetical protein
MLFAYALHVRYRGPFGPSLDHPGRGENLPGDMTAVMVWGAIELCVLALILGPWRQRHLIARFGVTTVLCACWAFGLAIAVMHSGSVWLTLVLWRFAIVGVFLLGFLGLTLR